MDWSDPRQRAVFFDAHSDLARQGPGNRASAARALELARPLPPDSRVADLGCGPGLQTLELAEMLPQAHIVGVDLHAPFVEHLRAEAERLGLADRVDARVGDLTELPDGGPFDLLWCEGAAYIAGFERALTTWNEWLAPGGRIALTEALWLTPDPPAAAVENWLEYPDMTNLDGCLERVARAGLQVLGHFTLPEEAWWEHYYGPMEARLAEIRPSYEGDEVALAVLTECQQEIDVYRAHSGSYGYEFFVVERA